MTSIDTGYVRPLARIAQLAAVAGLVGWAGVASADASVDARPSGWCYHTSEAQTILQNDVTRLDWQADGNLVAYDRTGTARWSTNTNDRGDRLCFWADGGFGVLDAADAVIWGTGTNGTVLRSFNGYYVIAVGGGGGDVFVSSQNNDMHERFDIIQHENGEVSLRTFDRAHYLIARPDGPVNAIPTQALAYERFWMEHNPEDGTVSFWSGVWGKYMRAWDGGGAGKRLSFDASQKLGHERFTLVVANRLVLDGCGMHIDTDEGPIWSASWQCVNPATQARTGLFRDEIEERRCWSTDEAQTLMQTARTRLEWQADGNLVAYDRDDGGARWQTGTAGRGRYTCFWPDGNFVVTNALNEVIWQTDTDGTAFRTLSGYYMIAVSGGGGDVFVSSRHNDIHERFDVIDAGDGMVNLRTHDDRHYLMPRDGDHWVFATPTVPDTWERFIIEDNGDNTVSFFSVQWQRYMSAWDGGGQGMRMATNATVKGPYERFTMLAPEKVTLEDCGLHVESAEGRIWSASWGCETPSAEITGPEPYGIGWGNGDFGSRLAAQVGYQRTGEDTTRSFADVRLNGRIFGNERTLIGAGAEVVSLDGETEGDASLEILGWSTSVALPIGEDMPLIDPINRHFFSASATFWLAFIPVTISASVLGEFGLNGNLDIDIGSGRVSATVSPSAELSASASLSVGLACLSAGIQAVITLIELGLPATVWVDPTAREVGFGASCDLEGLSGRLEIFADVCFDETSWTLVDWPSAFSSTWDLFPEQVYGF